MTLHVHPIAALGVAILAAAILAGCSSGGSSSSSNPAGAASTPTSSAAPVAVKVCDLLPVATVASVSGEDLIVATEDDTLSYEIYACDYTSADGTAGVRVTVNKGSGPAGYDADLSANGSATQISGLGDKAFSATTGVEALFGSTNIQVSDLQSDDACKTLIEDLQPLL